MLPSATSKPMGTFQRLLRRCSPRRLLRWSGGLVRLGWWGLGRKIRLWRLARLPNLPLDEDLYQLGNSVAGRTDDILSSIRAAGEPEIREWFRNVEPKIRDLARLAFRLIGVAQELRHALAMVEESDPGNVSEQLWSDLTAEQDPEMQRLLAQTLRTEQRKTESFQLCRRNLKLVQVKLGAILSFLDSIYLRVPNVKALADRNDWFASLSFELDNELAGLEQTFEEFQQPSLPQSPANWQSLPGPMDLPRLDSSAG